MSRALDALVAERITKLPRTRFPDGLMPDVDHWGDPPGSVSLPAYSTDMNRALEALEYAGHRILVERDGAGHLWCVTLYPANARLRGAGHESLPTALCIALLRAAGVDESEITAAMEGSDGP